MSVLEDCHQGAGDGDGEADEATRKTSSLTAPTRRPACRRCGAPKSEILDTEPLESCEHYGFPIARSMTAGSAVSEAAALTRSLTESDSDASGAIEATRTPMPPAER